MNLVICRYCKKEFDFDSDKIECLSITKRGHTYFWHREHFKLDKEVDGIKIWQ